MPMQAPTEVQFFDLVILRDGGLELILLRTRQGDMVRVADYKFEMRDKSNVKFDGPTNDTILNSSSLITLR